MKKKDSAMIKLEYIAYIANANGTNAIKRRVWENSEVYWVVKVNGTYHRLRWYNQSHEHTCKLEYAPV